MGDPGTSDSDARLARLEKLVDEQAATIAGLEQRLAPEPHRAAASANPAPADPESPSGLGRRRLLLGGAGAAAAGAVAMVASASPAAAANGDPLVLGADNASTETTLLLSADEAGAPGLRIGHTGTGPALEASNHPADRVGVHGDSNNGAGVLGTSDAGLGVHGTSNGAEGVKGESVSSSGVAGFSTDGPGLYGTSVNANGIVGVVDSTFGVFGQSNSGTGVVGLSTSWRGVYGQSDTDTAVVGLGGTLHGVGGYTADGSGVDANSDHGPGVTAQGGLTNLALPANGRAAPTGDAVAHDAGHVLSDAQGNLWVCVASGTPGTWRKAGGPATAGQFHVLPTPARIYDSRPGTFPSQGPKSPLVANTARTLDLTVNNSHVPPGATAALVTILLVNAAIGNGNFTVWANGATKPLANSMVWGGNIQRFSSTAVTALDLTAKVQVSASMATDLVLDVVGYYR